MVNIYTKGISKYQSIGKKRLEMYTRYGGWNNLSGIEMKWILDLPPAYWRNDDVIANIGSHTRRRLYANSIPSHWNL